MSEKYSSSAMYLLIYLFIYFSSLKAQQYYFIYMLRVILYISQTLNFNTSCCSNELSWLYMKGLLNFNINVLTSYCCVINPLKTQWYSAISIIITHESERQLAVVDWAKSVDVWWAFPRVCRSAGGWISKDDPTFS